VGDPGAQESSRRGLSTFLAKHEACGEGFDIQRTEGSDGSIVRVICGGCGRALEFPAASDVELPHEPAARSVPGRLRNRNRRSPERFPRSQETRSDAPAPPFGSGQSKADPLAAAESTPRPSWFSGWLAIPVIVALIGAGLFLVVLGVVSNSGRSGTTIDQSAGSPGTVPLTVPTVPIKKRAPAIRLDRRRFAERVSIGIPPGWNAGVQGGAVSVAALSGRAEVQIYFEHGARSNDRLTREARSFLLQRHARARVVKIGPTSLGGREVRRVMVVYPAGIESATVLVAGGYSYLILERLSRPFSRDLRRTAAAVVMSFRPT
jgi:hypothetical protein